MRLLSHLAVLGAAIVVLVLVYPSSRTKSKPIKRKNKVNQDRHVVHSLRATSKMTLSSLSQMTALSVQQPTKRLRLILHIGPPRISGSMSLQRELMDMTSLLAMDHYTYQGRQYDKYYNFILPPLLREARAMFTDCTLVPRSLCCDKFQKHLATFKKKKQNVIVSEESLTQLWKSPEDYHALQEALQHDWDVTVVVGYQRFYDWILSFKNHHSGDRFDDNQAGQFLLPIFPYLEATHWQVQFSDSAIANIRDSIPVELLSLYNGATLLDDSIQNLQQEHHYKYQSMTSNFLCQILKDAPNSCNDSLLRDANQNEVFDYGKDKHYSILSSRAPMFYDSLASAALTQGLVKANGHHHQPKRQRLLALAIQEHQERVLGKSHLDFNLVCPSVDNLEKLLHHSLQLEEELLPDEFVDMEEEHVAGFQSLVSSKAYCSIDTETVLKQKEWHEFFLQYPTATSSS